MVSCVVAIVLIVIGSFGADAGKSLVSGREFYNAIIQAGYPAPKKAQYKAFIHRLPAGNINSKIEAAMFLAHILWESGGLVYKSEIICQHSGCPGVYESAHGVPGKNYFGRGYIQLTHSYNYKPASLDLYHDLRLINNPEIVATNEDAAWGTAFWFWKKYVHILPGVQQHQFGVATRAINSMECTGHMPAARKRFVIYQKVLSAFHINEPANEHGCYN